MDGYIRTAPVSYSVLWAWPALLLRTDPLENQRHRYRITILNVSYCLIRQGLNGLDAHVCVVR
jgi:hypothetical protein